MALELKIGPDAINSYKRLSYTPWHAIAEFVDNSTQSYFDNRTVLNKTYKLEGEGLHISIVYDQKKGLLRVADNAMGMSYLELQRALHVGLPPLNPTGRSRYGLGLKTAACWLGNRWSVTTKKLGETEECRVTVEVDQVAAGKGGIQEQRISRPRDMHYTIVEIYEPNRVFQGRTLGKIADYLRSMYREDFRQQLLTLEWQGKVLHWEELDGKLLKAVDGTTYKKQFRFKVDDKPVRGWVGVLEHGSRAEAGFSMLHSGRVVKGWPDAWRPGKLFGQIQGTNDLVNQRLVGEIYLDPFEVSHTKDDILWLGTQEEEVEAGLYEKCNTYKQVAASYRKARHDERGPSDVDTSAAVDELKRELESPEMVDHIQLDDVPPPELVEETTRVVAETVQERVETFRADVRGLIIKGYIEHLSHLEPYVVVEATKEDEVLIVINSAHPHWKQIKGGDGVLNYLRHCVYDAVAEWKARQRSAALTPDTIKSIKDQLLRVSFEIEMHGPDEKSDVSEPEISF